MYRVSLAVVCMASAAQAGTASFSPDPLTIDLRFGSTGAVEVAVSAEVLASFDAVDLVITAGGVGLSGFTYSPAFIAATSFQVTPTTTGLGLDTEPYIYVGGLLDNPVRQIVVGTLLVDAAGADLADFLLAVSPELDEGLSRLSLGVAEEPIVGMGAVHVVPEPSTLAILVLGSAFLCLGRRLGHRMGKPAAGMGV